MTGLVIFSASFDFFHLTRTADCLFTGGATLSERLLTLLLCVKLRQDKMGNATMLYLACFWLLTIRHFQANGLCTPPPALSTCHPGRLAYSREHQLELYCIPDGQALIPPSFVLPLELIHGGKKRSHIRRKRGSRGGIRNRLRKRGRWLPLPALILSNVHSLWNQIEELSQLFSSDSDYRQTRFFCFMETCLSEEVNFNLESFHVVGFDRDSKSTWKSVGSGLCMLVNKNGQQT